MMDGGCGTLVLASLGVPRDDVGSLARLAATESVPILPTAFSLQNSFAPPLSFTQTSELSEA